MNTCDTCKWWNPPHKFVWRRGQDGPMLHETRLGDCSNPALYETNDSLPVPDVPNQCNGASTGFDSAFHSGPKFGCVHYQLSDAEIAARLLS